LWNLREDEIEALIGYLQKLAGVASAENSNLLVRESTAHVGEQVVKGTCHICHASLAGLLATHSLSSVQRQVRQGSPLTTRIMTLVGGDAMPAYPYLTKEEIAAAYYYLVEYPPQQ